MPIWTDYPLQRHTMAFYALLLLIAAASALFFVSIQRVLVMSDNSQNTQSALLALESFKSDMTDVETGARGYLLTGNPGYLAPYTAARRKIGSGLGRLHDEMRAHPGQMQRLERLRTLATERMMLSEQLVEQRRAGVNSAQSRATLDSGKDRMDKIRRVISDMQADMLALQLKERTALSEEARFTALSMLGGILISLAVLAGLFLQRSREIARRFKAEAELRTLNAELEERVQARTAELRKSNEIITAVINNIPDTVSLEDADADYQYILWNNAAEINTGQSRDKMIGHTAFAHFPRETAAHYRAENERILASGQAHKIVDEAVPTVFGSRIMEIVRVPIRDAEQGHWRYILNITHDLSEQRILERQVRQAQRIDAIGQLTGGLAHDFNNLLAIIMGNVDILRDRVQDLSDATELVDEVLDAAERGAELVHRLLAFARQQHLDPAAIDVNERLPETIALLQRVLGQNIKIEVALGAGPCIALIDPGQADDALVNLAINARDAMPDGGSLVIETANVQLDEDYASQHVEVSPGEYVMLSVSDTGTGMAPETAAAAFEPFFTTKEPGKGTGLGLSQVYGWAKQSGGHVKIYSELGHGTTVKLYLPRASGSAGTIEAEIERSELIPRGSETILVVEDNPNVLAMVVLQLKELGYQTLEAEDARDALVIVQSSAAFDLVLTDVVMPGGMTGYELASKIEALRPGTKILFTSGYTELAVRSGKGHGNAHKGTLLSKPYRKQELARAVRTSLDAEVK